MIDNQYNIQQILRLNKFIALKRNFIWIATYVIIWCLFTYNRKLRYFKTVVIYKLNFMMIKKTFALVLFSFLSTISFAQITYNSSSFSSAGDSIHLSNVVSNLQNQNFDTTGASITWDYSGLVVNSQSDTKWIVP